MRNGPNQPQRLFSWPVTSSSCLCKEWSLLSSVLKYLQKIHLDRILLITPGSTIVSSKIGLTKKLLSIYNVYPVYEEMVRAAGGAFCWYVGCCRETTLGNPLLLQWTFFTIQVPYWLMGCLGGKLISIWQGKPTKTSFLNAGNKVVRNL
jgi:hypothetical protein